MLVILLAVGGAAIASLIIIMVSTPAGVVGRSGRTLRLLIVLRLRVGGRLRLLLLLNRLVVLLSIIVFVAMNSDRRCRRLRGRSLDRRDDGSGSGLLVLEIRIVLRSAVFILLNIRGRCGALMLEERIRLRSAVFVLLNIGRRCGTLLLEEGVILRGVIFTRMDNDGRR